MYHDILVSQEMYNYIDSELDISADNICALPYLGKVKLHVVPASPPDTPIVPQEAGFYRKFEKRKKNKH